MARHSKWYWRCTTIVKSLACVFLLLSGNAASAAQVYWSDDDGIHRINTDSTGRQDIITAGARVNGLSADVAAGKLYWTQGASASSASIRRANLDGSGVENLIVNLDRADGIAVDPARSQFFWGGRPVPNDSVRMYHSNLDGTGTQLAFSHEPDIDGLFVDSVASKLYRLDLDDDIISRYNFDGGEFQEITSGAASMAVDPTGGSVYWATGLTLYRANLDGSNPQTVAALSLMDNARNIALDASAHKLYYTTTSSPIGGIFRSNLDGSQLERFADVPSSISQILIVSAVPEPSTFLLCAIGAGFLFLAKPAPVHIGFGTLRYFG